jgi:aryl carrier-like protein
MAMELSEMECIGLVLRHVKRIAGVDRDVLADEALLGQGGLLDSMRLVELCLCLEDEASNLGFAFDWTSDSAMSSFRSVFRTSASLSDEFNRQRALSASNSANAPQ